jgi:hypothetical protein
MKTPHLSALRMKWGPEMGLANEFTEMDRAKEALDDAYLAHRRLSMVMSRQHLATSVHSQFTTLEPTVTMERFESSHQSVQDHRDAYSGQLEKLMIEKHRVSMSGTQEERKILLANAKRFREGKIASINKWNGADAKYLWMMLADYQLDCRHLGYSHAAAMKKVRPKSKLPSFAASARRAESAFVGIDAKGVLVFSYDNWALEMKSLEDGDFSDEKKEFLREEITIQIEDQLMPIAQKVVSQMVAVAPLEKWRGHAFSALDVFEQGFVSDDEEIAGFCADLIEIHIDTRMPLMPSAGYGGLH